MPKSPIVRVTPPTGQLAKPDYLEGVEAAGTELLKQYVILPRLKVIQALSDPSLVSQFGVGAIIAVPLNVVVCELKRDAKGNPTGELSTFRFTPVFFWPEWWLCNPLATRGSEPMIAERSFDPASTLAIRARDPRQREQPHPANPAELKQRYVEVLNWAVRIRGDHPLAGEMLSMSFARGEFMAGSRLAGAIKMRNAPIYACVFEAHATQRVGTKGSWWGIDVTNPSDGSPWVEQDEYEQLKEVHEQLKKTHQEARLRAADDDESLETEDNVDTAAAGKY